MTTHTQTKTLPYSARQMFELVADVEKYPHFLPWCVGARILKRHDAGFNADLLIGYGFLRETFNSDVRLQPDTRIDIDYQNGPFRHLHNHWIFHDRSKKDLLQCELEFFIDFDFRSTLLKATIGVVFQDAVRSMIHAFEQRAKAVYG